LGNIFKQPCDEGIIRCGTLAVPCSRGAEPWILMATIIGSGMVMIDGTAVNVALPVLQEELNLGVTEVQWVVESYALILSALLLLGGTLGDHFGRRRIFTTGIALFTVASVCCGLAQTASQLILARAVQGAGGALLVPGSLAILSSSFKGDQRGRAIGVWAAFTPIAAALGPILGGWLVENASWRWVFFINVPLAIVVLTISSHCMLESRDQEKTGELDWWGALLAAAGLGAIVYGLIESANLGLTHPLVLVCVALGAALLVVFLLVEARSSSPILPLQLFRSRTFAGANLLTLLLYAALGGTLFFFPFNLIQVQGYSATAAGAAFLPLILLLFVLSRHSGELVSRYGAKWPLTVGPLVAAIGFVLFAIPGIGGSYWTTYFPAVAVLGLGMAVSVAPLTTTVMSSVDDRHAGIASGISNAAARTAGLLGVAVMGIFILNAFNKSLDSRMAALGIAPEVRELLDEQRINLAAAEIPTDLSSELRARLKLNIAESFLAGFRLVMFIAAGLALASAATALLMIEGKRSIRLQRKQLGA